MDESISLNRLYFLVIVLLLKKKRKTVYVLIEKRAEYHPHLLNIYY